MLKLHLGPQFLGSDDGNMRQEDTSQPLSLDPGQQRWHYSQDALIMHNGATVRFVSHHNANLKFGADGCYLLYIASKPCPNIASM